MGTAEMVVEAGMAAAVQYTVVNQNAGPNWTPTYSILQ